VQQESAESLTADLVMNHRKTHQYTMDHENIRDYGQLCQLVTLKPLPTSLSANPPCLHEVGPEYDFSSTVDVPILPRKEIKDKRGLSADSFPADLEMNYSKP
jgi:hypothetical protein